MTLIHNLLCIVVTSVVPLCFSQEEFRCKAVTGCEIARCDPSPLSWAHLDKNEFPINCVSDDASKEKRYKEKVKALESKVEDLTEELKRLWDMNGHQNDDIKNMKEQIKVLSTRTTVPTLTNIVEDDLTSRDLPKSCQDVKKADTKKTTESGGVFDIFVHELGKEIELSCDLKADGGGWTVFQRRMDGSENFQRGWDDYVEGFGRKDKEFWLGLENLHQMTKYGLYELRVDLEDFYGMRAYAKYGSFSIASAEHNYRLFLSSYTGTAGDSLIDHNEMQFSTINSDNDHWPGGDCAKEGKGGWWYTWCYDSNLNGVYHKEIGTGGGGVSWYRWKRREEHLKFSEMKFRKVH